MEGAPTRQLSLDARGAASAMTELVVQHASAPAPTRKGPPFRCAMGKAGSLTDKPMSGTGVGTWSAAVPPVPGIETAIGCHTFRATGITDYLTNGGKLEIAQRMAGHANAKTTGLYDRRNDDISVGEVERIGI